MSSPKPKITYRCRKCGGNNVGWDAVAYWCDEAQAPVLGSTYDDGWCDTCGPDQKLVELPLDGEMPTEAHVQ
jgi:hypothetical protein